MQEPKIIINGVTLTEAQAMTVRVALENFAWDLSSGSLDSPGEPNEHAKLYRERLNEVRKLM